MNPTRTTQITLMIIAVFGAGVIFGRKFSPPRASTEVQAVPAPPGSMTERANAESRMDVATLGDLLHETAEHHDSYEKTHPKHNWWDWYAPYIIARQYGSTPQEAVTTAGFYMEKLHKVVSR